MSKPQKSTIEVQGTAITIIAQQADDYISLTDIAKHKEPDRADHVIQNWMRNRNTVEFLGVWERLHNGDFKPLQFEGFQAGGLAAISRWLSEATPPDSRRMNPRIPKGCQP